MGTLSLRGGIPSPPPLPRRAGALRLRLCQASGASLQDCLILLSPEGKDGRTGAEAHLVYYVLLRTSWEAGNGRGLSEE